MKAFYSTPERIAVLQAAALRWVDTPWRANSDICGPRGGVACHNLPRAILMETGGLPASFPEFIGDPTETQHAKESKIEPLIDARPEFGRIWNEGFGLPPRNKTPGVCHPPIGYGLDVNFLQPGDLLGITIGEVVNHLALYLGGARREFIHVLMHKKAAVDSLHDPTWTSRLPSAWRPVVPLFDNHPCSSYLMPHIPVKGVPFFPRP